MDRYERPRHPIRVVATRTGMTPSALRAWERRYGVVDPARSDGGQRLYSDEDIERLSLLKRVTDAGRSIGDVAALPVDEVRRLAREDEEARSATARLEWEAAPTPVGDVADALRRDAMGAVEVLDGESLERTLRRGAAALGGLAFMEEVVTPLLHDVGGRWAEGSLRPAHEHLATAVVRRVLSWLGEAAPIEADRSLVVGTLPGERHELGAMLAATTAALEGWSVTYLGADLPPDEIASAASSTGASVVGISVAMPPSNGEAVDALAELRRALPPEVELLVGGGMSGEVVGAADLAGVRRVGSLVDFRDALRAVRRAGPAS